MSFVLTTIWHVDVICYDCYLKARCVNNVICYDSDDWWTNWIIMYTVQYYNRHSGYWLMRFENPPAVLPRNGILIIMLKQSRILLKPAGNRHFVTMGVSRKFHESNCRPQTHSDSTIKHVSQVALIKVDSIFWWLAKGRVKSFGKLSL